MYLKRLELQGFKTFAQKTVLEFEPDKDGRRGLTAIVGPNGSGKSNVADAIRWVMGEQSLKLLRCKKSEDVIFLGTEKKPRSGFAEVNMTMVNDDNRDVDFNEVVITRRLYRDGQSEYEVNKQAVRLTDVIMLLAQLGVGQRTYSVIGQGMVDEVLSSTPAERKVFFDEAAGLRPFQLKKQSSLNKLDASRDNLRQTDMLLKEIVPRLQTLERQVKRLQQREVLQAELKELELKYYGGMWRELTSAQANVKIAYDAAKQKVEQAEAEANKSEVELRSMEQAQPMNKEFEQLRAKLNTLMEERSKLREQQYKLEASREVAKAKSEKAWSPLPLSKIIESIEYVHAKQDELVNLFNADKPDVGAARRLIEELKAATADLIGKLQRPAPEPVKNVSDPKLEQELNDLVVKTADINAEIQAVQVELEQWNKTEQEKRSHLFEVQRRLSQARNEAQAAERRMNEAAVELARVETRRDSFLGDLRLNAPDYEARLDELAKNADRGETTEQLMPRISKLRAQLEWIGGIDPETIKEYEQTKARHDELKTQSDDLIQALASLETIIKELDETISERSRVQFRKLNTEFSLYFRKLFGGGEAGLKEVFEEAEVNELGEVIKEADPNAGPVGIEIFATPPGKRMKAIALLSGGERALVSIALICAIMATNPSPFVVLDEVDAALDEVNSRKFAEIVHSLADKTQFVIVTHNRATMEKGHLLYGVTMGDDGSSQLLSVKLNEVMAKP